MNTMGMFETGSRHSFYADDCCRVATIIFNNGTIAIGGMPYEVEHENSHDNDWEYPPFALRAEDIKAFIQDFEGHEGYESYIAIDMESGHLIEAREWLRRNNALFIPGKEYHAPEEWGCYMGKCITAYRHNGTAIIQVSNGEGCVHEAFRRFGYSAEEIRSVFPHFEDEFDTGCSDFFYICVRECDDVYVDLQGETIDDKIYGLI